MTFVTDSSNWQLRDKLHCLALPSRLSVHFPNMGTREYYWLFPFGDSESFLEKYVVGRQQASKHEFHYLSVMMQWELSGTAENLGSHLYFQQESVLWGYLKQLGKQHENFAETAIIKRFI